MKRNILCIVIALMVLSLSAIHIAKPATILFAAFESTLNGEPINVTLSQDNEKLKEQYSVKTIDFQELQDNWADHDRKFVQFTGTVAFVQKEPRTEQVQRLTLTGYTTHVYPLEAPDLPETYELGHTYEFTGLLIRDEEHAPNQNSRNVKLRIYAVKAEALGKAK